MELKLLNPFYCVIFKYCLNRTFYGIETLINQIVNRTILVLIVPFMELKLDNRTCSRTNT